MLLPINFVQVHTGEKRWELKKQKRATRLFESVIFLLNKKNTKKLFWRLQFTSYSKCTMQVKNKLIDLKKNDQNKTLHNLVLRCENALKLILR